MKRKLSILIPVGVIPFALFLLGCGAKEKADLKKYLGYEYAETENSLLWEITGNGLEQPSFLYGSIHIQRKEVFAFDSLILKIIDTVDAFAMEINPTEVSLEKTMSAMNLDTPLDEQVPIEKFNTLDSIYFAGTGNHIDKNKKPFFVMAEMMKKDIGGDMALPLDLFFFSRAMEKKKKIIGVEKFEDQLAAIDQLTIEEQVDMIIDGMKDTTSSMNKFDDMLQVYLNQDLIKMMELTKDPSYPEKFNKAFLTDRNINMADKIAEIVKQQTTFIAIGAAHLGGPEGVIEYLRKKGFTVKPVKFQFNR
jgi:uncharacterized protein